MMAVTSSIVLLNIPSLLLKVLLDYHVTGDSSIYIARSHDCLASTRAYLLLTWPASEGRRRRYH